MIINPLTASLLMGGATALMNGVQGGLGSSAARQSYLNDKAFQGASTQFAQWQANFNRRVTDANSQYNYWQETVNYNQNLAYAKSLRNYELVRQINQADVVGQARASAGSDYVRTSEAIGQSLAERSMQDAVALQQYTVAALKARSSVMAGGQEGSTIDRLINDYARQVGDYQTISSINQGLQQRQYTREQAGAVAQYLNAYNSQTFYEAQPYLEPMAPFMPLPALLEAPAPTMTGAAPRSNTGLMIGSALVGGVTAGLGTYQSMARYTTSGANSGQQGGG